MFGHNVGLIYADASNSYRALFNNTNAGKSQKKKSNTT